MHDTFNEIGRTDLILAHQVRPEYDFVYPDEKAGELSQVDYNRGNIKALVILIKEQAEIIKGITEGATKMSGFGK